MTKTEARQLVLDYLKAHSHHVELVLIDEQTLERDFGWVFFYDSKVHIETGNLRDAIAGNAPIVVTKVDGQPHMTGTAYPLEHYLKKFAGSQNTIQGTGRLR